MICFFSEGDDSANTTSWLAEILYAFILRKGVVEAPVRPNGMPVAVKHDYLQKPTKFAFAAVTNCHLVVISDLHTYHLVSDTQYARRL